MKKSSKYSNRLKRCKHIITTCSKVYIYTKYKLEYEWKSSVRSYKYGGTGRKILECVKILVRYC